VTDDAVSNILTNTSIHAVSRRATISLWPSDLAIDRAVLPSGSAAFAEAPAINSAIITLRSPFQLATINGVQPSLRGMFTSAPNDVKVRTVGS
jgi:hypothetical protein